MTEDKPLTEEDQVMEENFIEIRLDDGAIARWAVSAEDAAAATAAVIAAIGEPGNVLNIIEITTKEGAISQWAVSTELVDAADAAIQSVVGQPDTLFC